MNSNLFGLITKAGSASLGELMARSSLPASALAHEIAEMVRNGDVTLSIGASKPTNVPASEFFAQAAQQSPAFTEVVGLIETPNKLVDLAQTQNTMFVDGIQFALKDDLAAEGINVNPTSKGFRYSA